MIEANKKFYEAFQAQSVAKMREVWGKGSHVQCIHPGNTSIATREEVIESWKIIFSDSVARFSVCSSVANQQLHKLPCNY